MTMSGWKPTKAWFIHPSIGSGTIGITTVSSSRLRLVVDICTLVWVGEGTFSSWTLLWFFFSASYFSFSIVRMVQSKSSSDGSCSSCFCLTYCIILSGFTPWGLSLHCDVVALRYIARVFRFERKQIVTIACFRICAKKMLVQEAL